MESDKPQISRAEYDSSAVRRRNSEIFRQRNVLSKAERDFLRERAIETSGTVDLKLAKRKKLFD